MQQSEYPLTEGMMDDWLEKCRNFSEVPENEVGTYLSEITLELRSLLLALYSDALMGEFSEKRVMELDVIETSIFDLRLPTHPTEHSVLLHNHLMTQRLETIEEIADIVYNNTDAPPTNGMEPDYFAEETNPDEILLMPSLESSSVE